MTLFILRGVYSCRMVQELIKIHGLSSSGISNRYQVVRLLVVHTVLSSSACFEKNNWYKYFMCCRFLHEYTFNQDENLVLIYYGLKVHAIILFGHILFLSK